LLRLSGEKGEEEDWWLLDQVATSSHLVTSATIPYTVTIQGYPVVLHQRCRVQPIDFTEEKMIWSKDTLGFGKAEFSHIAYKLEVDDCKALEVYFDFGDYYRDSDYSKFEQVFAFFAFFHHFWAKGGHPPFNSVLLRNMLVKRFGLNIQIYFKDYLLFSLHFSFQQPVVGKYKEATVETGKLQ
jgi:hypothetical protein